MCSDVTDKMAASEEIYEVEHILAKRQSRKAIEYLIRWKGFDSCWDTWEPVANLGDAMDIVEEFNDRMALNQLMGIKPKNQGAKRSLGAVEVGDTGVNGLVGAKANAGSTVSPAPAKKAAKSQTKTPNGPKDPQTTTDYQMDVLMNTPDVAKNSTTAATKSPKKKKAKVEKTTPVVKVPKEETLTPVSTPEKEKLEDIDLKLELDLKDEKSPLKQLEKVSKKTSQKKEKGSKKVPKTTTKGNQKTSKPKVVSTKATKNSNKAAGKPAAKKGTVKEGKKAAGGGVKAKASKSKATESNSELPKDSEIVEIDNNGAAGDAPNAVTEIKSAFTKVVKPKKTASQGQKEKVKGTKTPKVPKVPKTPKVKKTSEKGTKKQLKTKKTAGVKRKRPSVLDTPSDPITDTDDDDILYSINEDHVTPPKGKKRKKLENGEHDPEVTFQRVVSPGRKVLLKDSMKSKTKIVKPVPRMPVSPSRVRSPIFLSEVPSSPYKTPPSSPSSISPAHMGAGLPAHGREAPPAKEFFLSDLPAVPVIPVIPSSPSAASYKKVLAKSYPPDKHKSCANHTAEEEEEEEEENVERRTSVRQSECTFRYKEIVVRKCRGYTQVWLFTQTKIKNCLNPSVLSELKQVLHTAKYDDSRLVMISGSGSTFCSGVDLHYLQNGHRKQAAETMAESVRDFVSALISFPKLLVAAVNGPAIGLGVSILPLFDIIYASDKASFYCPYARLAQTPEACASYTFPSIMGNAMGNEMLLGGRKLTAIEAYQIGLVSQVFWPTSMMQQVMPRVQNLVMYSAKALEQSKMLIRSHQKAKLEFTNESECRMLGERWSTSECHKAIKEYLEDEQDILV